MGHSMMHYLLEMASFSLWHYSGTVVRNQAPNMYGSVSRLLYPIFQYVCPQPIPHHHDSSNSIDYIYPGNNWKYYRTTHDTLMWGFNEDKWCRTARERRHLKSQRGPSFPGTALKALFGIHSMCFILNVWIQTRQQIPGLKGDKHKASKQSFIWVSWIFCLGLTGWQQGALIWGPDSPWSIWVVGRFHFLSYRYSAVGLRSHLLVSYQVEIGLSLELSTPYHQQATLLQQQHTT